MANPENDDWQDVPISPPTVRMRQEGDGPDDWQDVDAAPANPDAPGALSTFFRSAGHIPGVDQLAGAAGAIANIGSDRSLEDFAHDYRFIRDRSRSDREAGADAHPLASALGTGTNIGLSLLAPMPGGGATQAASVLGRIGNAAKAGAMFGGASGLLEGKADLTNGDVLGALRDTAVGAGLGATMGGAGGGAAEAAGPLAAKLKDLANSEAVNAVLPMLRGYRKLGDDGVQKMGQELLYSGAVRFGDNVQNINERLTPMREEVGQQIGQHLQELDRLAPSAESFQMNPVLQRAQREIVQPMAKNPIAMRVAGYKGGNMAPIGSPFEHGVNLRNAMEELATRPKSSFANANQIKSSLDEGLFSQLDAPAKIDQVRQLRGILNNEIEGQAQQVSPDVADALIAAKQRYSNLAPADKFAQDQALRQMANRKISPSDYATGLAEWQQSGNSWLSAATLGAHHLLRTRGAASTAVTADLASRVMAVAGRAGQKYAQAFSAAAARSPAAVAALDFVLTQRDPEWRQAKAAGNEQP